MIARDRRTTPANGRVAADHLRGHVEAERFVTPKPGQIQKPVADLWRLPGGARDRQLMFGDTVAVLERRGGFAFVQAKKDGYVGYVTEDSVSNMLSEPTHWVAALATHAYPEPNFKLPEAHALPFGAQVSIVSHQPRFFETSDGLFIPKPHLWPIDKRFADPVTAAQMFFGRALSLGREFRAWRGLLRACTVGLARGGMAVFGRQRSARNAGRGGLPGAGLMRGDLLFWKGHVALAVDDATLIHANAHHMAVAYEPVDKAVRRIDAQGDGPVIAHRRMAKPA